MVVKGLAACPSPRLPGELGKGWMEKVSSWALASPQPLDTKVFSTMGLFPISYKEGRREGAVLRMWLCHQLLTLGTVVFIILHQTPGRCEWGWMQFGGNTGVASRVNTPALTAVFQPTWLLPVLVSLFPALGKHPMETFTAELHAGLCRDLLCSRPDARVVVTSCRYLSLEAKRFGICKGSLHTRMSWG